MQPFRFGVGMRGFGSRDEWIAKCRRAEELGYDVIAVPDHLGSGHLGPLPALAVAAAVTDRPRVTPFVLNVPFYNPALLARDVATTSGLAGDRLELGLGAGHMRSEFDDARLPWLPARERIAYLGRTIGELRERLGDDLPPLLIAGNSDGVLDVAAREADIVGFSGLVQVRGKPPGTFRPVDAEALDERVTFLRERTGTREPQLNMLLQDVIVTDDPGSEIARWCASLPHLGERELAEAPQLLFGSLDEIIARVRGMRERYGFTYFTVFEAAMETFAPVMRALAADEPAQPA